MIARWHLVVGLGTVAVFVATGLYLRINLESIVAQGDAVRYQARANHVYILLSGLLNLLAYRLDIVGRVRVAGSVVLMLAPVVLIAAFVFEPWRGSPVRLVTAGGVGALVLGVLMVIIGSHRAGVEPGEVSH